MTYRIEAIELYVRETPPGRMVFSLGKKGGAGDIKKGLVNPLAHVRIILKDSDGNETFGCAGDRLSVRWLDKRPGRSHDQKRRDLVALIEWARELYLKQPAFDSPFEIWHRCHSKIMKAGREAKQEDLTSSFASSLFERAIVDAVCRLGNKSVFEMFYSDQLGFRPQAIHSELGDLDVMQLFPKPPQTEFYVRHTVGLLDPLAKGDLPDEKRVNDGLPETLEEYVKTDGIRYFKVKISGDPKRDLERLAKIWEVVLHVEEPVITLDANEAYHDLALLDDFVRRFEEEQIGCFQHVEYIEQPLPRALTLDPKTKAAITKLSERKQLLIDEADGTLDSFKRAHRIGYQGTSHKNCKGFFKSLANFALVAQYGFEGHPSFMSAEDLQNLPVVPLQQDFCTVGLLGLNHCERNGHHYNYGLSLLSEKDRANAVKSHPDLYVQRGDEWFLNIVDGVVRCDSLVCTGFGVHDEPDWPSMMSMKSWVRKRHPV